MRSVRKKSKSIKSRELASKKTSLKIISVNSNKRKQSMLSARLRSSKSNGKAAIYREHISYSSNKKKDMKSSSA
jgi:hypothetical protein